MQIYQCDNRQFLVKSKSNKVNKSNWSTQLAQLYVKAYSKNTNEQFYMLIQSII